MCWKSWITSNSVASAGLWITHLQQPWRTCSTELLETGTPAKQTFLRLVPSTTSKQPVETLQSFGSTWRKSQFTLVKQRFQKVVDTRCCQIHSYVSRSLSHLESRWCRTHSSCFQHWNTPVAAWYFSILLESFGSSHCSKVFLETPTTNSVGTYLYTPFNNEKE